jgi:hypothetical protein
VVVRSSVKSIDKTKAVVPGIQVWRNQNPFKSMFEAVQGMAAGFLRCSNDRPNRKCRGRKISMLVVCNANFSKKQQANYVYDARMGM